MHTLKYYRKSVWKVFRNDSINHGRPLSYRIGYIASFVSVRISMSSGVWIAPSPCRRNLAVEGGGSSEVAALGWTLSSLILYWHTSWLARYCWVWFHPSRHVSTLPLRSRILRLHVGEAQTLNSLIWKSYRSWEMMAATRRTSTGTSCILWHHHTSSLTR